MARVQAQAVAPSSHGRERARGAAVAVFASVGAGVMCGGDTAVCGLALTRLEESL